MALINCPNCKKRVSSKAKVCSHCNSNLTISEDGKELTEEQIASRAKLARIKMRYSLQMQAMAGIILFIAGFMLWYFVGNKGLTEVSHFVQIGIALAGGVWYLITRVRLITFKAANKN